MRLKYLALTCLLIFTAVASRPPRLGWEGNMCWDNVVIQLLYNMRGVTECLLKNAGECRQKNRVLEKYVDLITAIRNNPDGYFIDEMRAYHEQVCGVMGCPMCKFFRADYGFVDLLGKNFSCCRDWFEMQTRSNSTKKLSVRYNLQVNEWFDTIAAGIAGNSDEKSPISFRIENIPPYLFIWLTNSGSGKISNFNLTDENIDIAPILSEELKKAHKNCFYELIGISEGVGGHNTAYIKDQWAETPGWYYCDDMAVRNEGAEHVKLDKLPVLIRPLLQIGGYDGPDWLVYKRVDAGMAKPQAGAPVTQVVTDNRELEKLVQALHELAGGNFLL